MEFALFLAVVLISALVYFLIKKQKQLKRYQGIIDLEAEQTRLANENQKLTAENEKIKTDGRAIRDAIVNLKSQLASLEDEQALTEFGLYEPKYDFGTSARYKEEIDRIRQQQKQLVRDKKAILWGTEWRVEGSKTKGRTMMNQQTRLMLYAFNGECDSLIIKVKYNNFEQVRKRIQKAYDDVNKLGKTQNCRINPAYLNLKFQELHLVHEYQEKREAEKEEQRQIREEMREEQRAQRELEQAQREAEKEQEHYQKALDKVRKEIEAATGEKHAELEGEIERLTQALAEAEEKKERAISRAQMTRSGHVYVISNIGSFGEGVYKIGMTRRLEPMDRVKELGDASVPFSFDVHALIYSEDAPSLETALHQKFDSSRINLVNTRKEFFKAGLEEIAQVVKENHGEVEFTLKAEAEEYHQTKAVLKQRSENGVEAEQHDALFEAILDA